MTVTILTTCHTQYTSDSSIYVFFYLTEQRYQFSLHTLQVLYMCTVCDSTGLFEMTVRVQLSSGNSAPNSGNNHHLTIPFEGGMHNF
jgi:hypothetical protein